MSSKPGNVARLQEAALELLAIQKAIASVSDDRDQVLQAVVDGALRLFPFARGAIIEMRRGDQLVYTAVSGRIGHLLGASIPIEGSLSGQCIRTGEGFICKDSEADSRINREICRRVGLRSAVMVPLPLQNEQVGVLKIYSDRVRAFDHADLLLSELAVSPIAFGLASAAQAASARAHDEISRRFEATFHQAAVGIAHVAVDGRFMMANDRFCEIAGHSREALIAGGFQQITHPEDLDSDLAKVALLINGAIDHYSMEKRYVREDGTISWVNLTVSAVRNDDGEASFFVAVIEDISRRKRAELVASLDLLTGLPNRLAMLEELKLMLADRSDGRMVSVAFLDLDAFKQVNDRLGHTAGDRCLVTISRTLQASLRGSDILYRIAGDEFVLLSPDIDGEELRLLLSRLEQAIGRVSDANGWGVGVSIGAVLVPPGRSTSPEAVLEAADQLMYRVKRKEFTEPAIDIFPGKRRSRPGKAQAA